VRIDRYAKAFSSNLVIFTPSQDGKKQSCAIITSLLQRS